MEQGGAVAKVECPRLPLERLAPKIEERLCKLAGKPTSQAVRHWKSEIQNLMEQMRSVMDSAGKNTPAERQVRLAEWEARLKKLAGGMIR